MLRGVAHLKSGHYGEFGVDKGRMSRVIYRLMTKDAHLYLFDTFQGFHSRDLDIEQQEIGTDRNYARFANKSAAEVLHYVCNGDDPRVHTVSGRFPESFTGYEELRWRFVHIDFDLYEPIRRALDILWPKLVSGGIIMIHDTRCPSYPGARRAVEEFAETIGATPIIFPDRWGTAIFCKHAHKQIQV